MPVPTFNEHYPSLNSANKEQRIFYKRFSDSLGKKEYIDIDGNLSYVFVYLYKIIKQFVQSKNTNKLIEEFEFIHKNYSNYEKIKLYLNHWLQDAYLYLSDYENAWKYLRITKNSSVSDIINIRGNCKITSIDAKDLFYILKSDIGLTPFGKENINEVEKLVNIFLDDFFVERKVNYVEFFLKRFDYGNISEDDFLFLRECYINEEHFSFWKNEYIARQTSTEKTQQALKHPRIARHYLFGGTPIDNNPFREILEIPYVVHVGLENRFKSIIREAENTVRVEKNLPKVGEGWINEASLFRKIISAFPDEKIKHHGKPFWLGRQHFDIYFTEKNIALEYQGSQHFKPIDFFGGEEGFKKIQLLDKKKKKLCEKHNCHLIYVYEDYNFENIVNQIKVLL